MRARHLTAALAVATAALLSACSDAVTSPMARAPIARANFDLSGAGACGNTTVVDLELQNGTVVGR